MIKRILYIAWLTIALLLVSFALISSSVRLLSPMAGQYKDRIESLVEDSLQQPVTIEKISLGWRWLTPIIQLHNVQLLNSEKLTQTVRVERISLGINLWSSLRKRQIEPDELHIRGADIYLKQVDDGALSVNNDSTLIVDLTAWLLHHQKISLSNINIQWQTANGAVIPLRQVTVSASKRWQRLRIEGSAQLSQTVESMLEFSANFALPTKNTPELNWQGQVYVEANDVLIAQWLAGYQYADLQVASGQGDFKLWLDVVDNAISKAQTEFALENLHLEHAQGKSQFLHRLSANVLWKNLPSKWSLAADKIFIRMAGVDWPENKLSYKVDKQTQQQEIYIQYLQISELFNWLNLWEELDWLTQYQPGGIINEIHWVDHKLKASLQQFSFKPSADLPHLNNISGKVNLSWQGDATRWQLKSEQLDLSSPLLEIDTSLDLAWEQSLRSLKLDAQFKLKNMLAAKAYIPKQVMDEGLYAWLQNAITNPALATGRISINHGLGAATSPLRIDAKIYNLNLDYAEGWPVGLGTHASLNYENNLLSVIIHETQMQNIPMKNIKLRIPDIGIADAQQWLYLDAHLPTTLETAMEFIKHSPLRDDLDNLLQLEPQGAASLQLGLAIPLSEDSKLTTRVKGHVQLQAAQITASDWSINQITGDVAFTEKEYWGDALSFTLYDYPGTANIHSNKVTAHGSTHASIFAQRFQLPLLTSIKEDINYKAQLDTLANSPMRLTVDADLSGITLDYPSPFGKKAAEELPLQFIVTFPFAAQKQTQLDINYADRLRGRLLLDDQQLIAAEIHLGDQKPILGNPEPGLNIYGELKQLDLNEWQLFFNQLNTAPATNEEGAKDSATQLFKQLKLKTKTLLWREYQFNNSALSLTRQGAGWNLGLEGEGIVGDLKLSDKADAPLTFNFSRLYLPKLEAASAASNETPTDAKPLQVPSDWPAIDLHISDFKYGNLVLGALDLSGRGADNRYNFTKIQLTHPSYSFEGTGSWQQQANEQRSFLNGALRSSNLGESLRAWHYPSIITSKTAEFNMHLNWSGDPRAFALKTLQGDFAFKLRNGAIPKLEENTEKRLGMGKLISILSLQTIPRRLLLDFSDLSGKGFSFESFGGDFTVNKGVANTQNTTLSGAIAHVAMNGDIDLAQRNYDLQLKVAPHVTASLPLIATLAGGPIVGAIAWAADKLIMQPMQRVSAYVYDLNGSWDNPQIEADIVDENNKLIPGEVVPEKLKS